MSRHKIVCMSSPDMLQTHGFARLPNNPLEIYFWKLGDGGFHSGGGSHGFLAKDRG